MREIKFRGWHTVKKLMFSAEEMATDQLALLPTGSFINVSGNSTRLSEIYPKDKFIPLQYAGLKDKNGVEIYEGDIAQMAGRARQPRWEIVWYENGWQMRLVWLDKQPLPERYYVKLSSDRVVEFDEVIGNIYENPELLGRGK